VDLLCGNKIDQKSVSVLGGYLSGGGVAPEMCDLSWTFHRIFAGWHREAEVAERCTFTTRTAIRDSKLVDQNDWNIFRVYFDTLGGDAKCLMSIAMTSATCLF